jgi:hypothetical protein
LDTVNERARLLQRQKELETAVKQLGGARIIEEQELLAVKGKLQEINEAARTADGRMADGAARAARCSLADFAPRNISPNP